MKRYGFIVSKILLSLIVVLISICLLCGCDSKSKNFLKINSFFDDADLSANIKCEGWFTSKSVLFESKGMSLDYIANKIQEHPKKKYDVIQISDNSILITQKTSSNKNRYYMICKTNTEGRFFAFDMCIDLDGIYKRQPVFCKVIFPYQFSDLLTQQVVINGKPISLSWDWNNNIVLNDGVSIESIQEFYSSLGMYEIKTTENGFVLQKNDSLHISLCFSLQKTEDGENMVAIHPIN